MADNVEGARTVAKEVWGSLLFVNGWVHKNRVGGSSKNGTLYKLQYNPNKSEDTLVSITQ